MVYLFQGEGSTEYFAVEAMAGLHSIITALKAKLGLDRIRLLDIPCGDMVWMSRFLDARDDINYTGIDIVPVCMQILNCHCFQTRSSLILPINEVKLMKSQAGSV